MKTVFYSVIFGISCLVVGKDKLRRGRGGKMTKDGGNLILTGIVATICAFILFIDIFTTWLSRFLTNLADFVNSVVPIALSQYMALALIIGIVLLIAGLIGAVIPYMRVWLIDKISQE